MFNETCHLFVQCSVTTNTFYRTRICLLMLHPNRDVHDTGIPISPMGIPWEWET